MWSARPAVETRAARAAAKSTAVPSGRAQPSPRMSPRRGMRPLLRSTGPGRPSARAWRPALRPGLAVERLVRRCGSPRARDLSQRHLGESRLSRVDDGVEPVTRDETLVDLEDRDLGKVCAIEVFADSS